MGKLTSLILGFVAVCALVFYYMSTSYAGMIAWLGPLFGPQLIYAMGFLILFFGNPVVYPVVLASWIAIGFIVAVGSRKGLRSAGAAASLFFLSLSFFGTVAASLIIPFISGSSGLTSTLTSFPPPPPGTSLMAITSAPVLSGLISILQSLLSGSGLTSFFPVTGGIYHPVLSLPGAPSGLPLSQIATFLLVPLILNLVTVIVSAGIFGSIFKKFSRTGKNGTRVAGPALVIVIVLLLLTGFSVHAVPGQANALNRAEASATGNAVMNVSGNILNYYSPLAAGQGADPYYEAVASYVAPSGSIYNFYAYANAFNGTLQSSSFFNLSGVSGSALTLLMGSSGLQNFAYGNLSLGGLGFLSSFGQPSLLQMIPGVILASVYPGGLSSTSSEFNGVLNSVEGSLGFGLQKILVYELNVSGSSSYSIYIYGSEKSLQFFSPGYVKYAVDGFSQSGLISVLQNGISSGALVPGSSSSSADGSILFSAFVNTADSSAIGSFSSLAGNITQGYGKFAVTGAFSVKNHQYHSSSNLHSITLSGNIGYSGTMHFDQSSAGSLVLLAVPDVRNSTVTGAIPENYTAYFSSAKLLSMLPFGTSNMTSLNYSPSAGIAATSVVSSSNWTYPRAISSSVSMSVGQTGRVTVQTVLTNNDNVSVSGITVNESAFSSMYSAGITNLSLKPVFNVNQLSPGASDTLSFSFMPTGVGNYTVPSVTVSYSEFIPSLGKNMVVNDTFSGSSIRIQAGNFVTVANHVEYMSLSTIGNYVPFFGYFSYSLFPGFYMFDLVLVLVVILDGLLEWRAYRKSKRR